MSNSDERYAFIAEWYDVNAALIRNYHFLYYQNDSTIEMFDIQNKRVFLKRSKFENLSVKDLYIGSIINVHARQLKLTDYADHLTKNKLEKSRSRTFAMIKPEAIIHTGEIISRIYKENFVICQIKKVELTRADAAIFYDEHKGKPFFGELLDYLTSGPVVALELMGEDCVKKWRTCLGPTNSLKAKQESPNSIRAIYGTDGTKNACHGSDSSSSSARELEFFFGPKSPKPKAKFKNCTLCIVKPHAAANDLLGNILSAIQREGFELSTLQMYRLEKNDAEEFFEIYKGVVSEYCGMVDELCSGNCVAIEITKDENTPTKFREFVGPSDPEIARHLRPHTLRAQFGIDKVKNAVHCTDLPDDGILEVEYFFRILNS